MITIPWLVAAIAFLIDQLIMTRLIRRQYEEHRTLWEKDGQPRPMFWIPPETVVGGWYLTYRSGRAFQVVAWRWLFFTPDWIRGHKDPWTLLVAHRILLTIAFLCVVAPFIIAAVSQQYF
jgi:hypothetical protein